MKIETITETHKIYRLKYRGYKCVVVTVDNIDPVEKVRWPHLKDMLTFNCRVVIKGKEYSRVGKINKDLLNSESMLDFYIENIILDPLINKFEDESKRPT